MYFLYSARNVISISQLHDAAWVIRIKRFDSCGKQSTNITWLMLPLGTTGPTKGRVKRNLCAAGSNVGENK